MDEEYLSVDDAARELGVSRATAWKWIRRRELQTYRFMGDRKTYVKRDDLATLREPIPVESQKKQAA